MQDELKIMRPNLLYKLGLINMCWDMSTKSANKLIGVEIGSYAGESAELFLKSDSIQKLYCIDPWDSNTNHNYANTLKQAEQLFDTKFNNNSAIVKCRGVITDFATKLSDIDFVYIDGSHLYEDIKLDIVTSLNIIKPKIAICGHDYFNNNVSQVKLVVNELLGTPDKIYSDTSWIKYL